ncbi:MAG: Ig-like domain-containing protein [bacterium]|nr:Ig-like domain-containing protein [bacterium]
MLKRAKIILLSLLALLILFCVSSANAAVTVKSFKNNVWYIFKISPSTYELAIDCVGLKYTGYEALKLSLAAEGIGYYEQPITGTQFAFQTVGHAAVAGSGIALALGVAPETITALIIAEGLDLTADIVFYIKGRIDDIDFTPPEMQWITPNYNDINEIIFHIADANSFYSSIPEAKVIMRDDNSGIDPFSLSVDYDSYGGQGEPGQIVPNIKPVECIANVNSVGEVNMDPSVWTHLGKFTSTHIPIGGYIIKPSIFDIRANENDGTIDNKSCIFFVSDQSQMSIYGAAPQGDNYELNPGISVYINTAECDKVDSNKITITIDGELIDITDYKEISDTEYSLYAKSSHSLSLGPHNVKIEAYDRQGIMGELAWSFNIVEPTQSPTITDPTITVGNPSHQVYDEDFGLYNISVNIDPNFIVQQAFVVADSNPNYVLAHYYGTNHIQYTWDSKCYPYGTMIFTIFAVDANNNYWSKSATINYNPLASAGTINNQRILYIPAGQTVTLAAGIYNYSDYIIQEPSSVLILNGDVTLIAPSISLGGDVNISSHLTCKSYNPLSVNNIGSGTYNYIALTDTSAPLPPTFGYGFIKLDQSATVGGIPAGAVDSNEWTNKNIFISWNAGNDGNGVGVSYYPYYFGPDSAGQPVNNGQKVANDLEGINYLRVGAFDHFGNSGLASLVYVSKKDTTLPEFYHWKLESGEYVQDKIECAPSENEFILDTQRPDCSIKVSDKSEKTSIDVCGLDVESAYYRFSTDSGNNWSNWKKTSCSGVNGSTGWETITAENVPFDQDSDKKNYIQYKISDMVGNESISPSVLVKINTNPIVFSGFYLPYDGGLMADNRYFIFRSYFSPPNNLKSFDACIDGTQYCQSNGNPESGVLEAQLSQMRLSPGIHTLNFSIEDINGYRTSQQTRTFRVVKPEVTLTIDPAEWCNNYKENNHGAITIDVTNNIADDTYAYFEVILNSSYFGYDVAGYQQTELYNESGYKAIPYHKKIDFNLVGVTEYVLVEVNIYSDDSKQNLLFTRKGKIRTASPIFYQNKFTFENIEEEFYPYFYMPVLKQGNNELAYNITNHECRFVPIERNIFVSLESSNNYQIFASTVPFGTAYINNNSSQPPINIPINQVYICDALNPISIALKHRATIEGGEKFTIIGCEDILHTDWSIYWPLPQVSVNTAIVDGTLKLNLAIQVGNSYQTAFDLLGLKVTVQMPELDYSEVRTVDILASETKELSYIIALAAAVTPGNHAIKVILEAANKIEKEFYYSVIDNGEDKEVPSTEIKTSELVSISGAKTYISDQTQIYFVATDSGTEPSGIDFTEYAIDASTWTVYASSFTLAGEGEHTVEYRSRDKAGNLEDTKQAIYYLDTTAPESQIVASGYEIAEGTTTYINSHSTFTISAIDPLSNGVSSGIKNMQYKIDAGSFTIIPSTTNYQLSTNIPDGQHTITYQAMDNVGNLEALRTFTSIFDSTKPQVKSTYPANNGKVKAKQATPITIAFSEPVQSADWAKSIEMRESGKVVEWNSKKGFNITYDTTTYTVSIDGKLKNNRVYEVILKNTISDRVKNYLDEYQFSFQTIMNAAEGGTLSDPATGLTLIIPPNALPCDGYFEISLIQQANPPKLPKPLQWLLDQRKAYQIIFYDEHGAIVKKQVKKAFAVVIILKNQWIALTQSQPQINPQTVKLYQVGSIKEVILPTSGQAVSPQESQPRFAPVLMSESSYDAQEEAITVEVNSFGIFNLAGFTAPDNSLDDLSCYPNPFNPCKQNITIQYYLLNESEVTIAIYDLLGNLVKTWEIPTGEMNARSGLNQLSWDGRNGQGDTVANGGYILFVHSDGQKKKFKILVVK